MAPVRFNWSVFARKMQFHIRIRKDVSEQVCVWQNGVRVVCDNAVCQKAVHDKVVCDNVACACKSCVTKSCVCVPSE